MTRDQLITTRQALISQLPVTGEILRGSLVERTVSYSRGCTICAGGGGHPLSVLTVTYAGGRTRQFSLRRDARGQSVIERHRAQRSFGDGLIAEEVKGLHEPWMKHAD